MNGKHQTGYIWRVGDSWYGRWYEDVISDGTVKDYKKRPVQKGEVARVQHSETLAEYGDRYRYKKDVQPLIDKKLRPINEGRSSAQSTLSIMEYFDRFYLPQAQSELKASTFHGYKGLWRMYLKPHLGNVTLCDFTCGQATKLLAVIHSKHGLSRKSLRHCKGLLQTIFSHAKQTDVLDNNPVQGAKVPRAAQSAGDTPAYTTDEMMSMLHTLTGTAKAAVALMYFCGLRPGEARAAKWTDLDEAKRIICIQRSIWRKQETGPKTQDSIAPVHIPKVLADILSELPRSSEYILATPTRRPIDLHNLSARVIVPSLKRCAVCRKMESKHEKVDHEFRRDPSLPVWKGFYALRRGIGTALADVDNALAAKSHLRHANVSTTTAHYVKSVDAAAIRAMDKINALFDNTNASGRPN
jgi:integrase